MVPTVNDILNQDLEVKPQPSLQHHMIPDKVNFKDNRIIGECDSITALRQTIFKILNTERYEHEIYSWNYGVELMDLYGRPVTLVCPEVQRRITEALIQDDRITSVDSFTFDLHQKKFGVCAFCSS